MTATDHGTEALLTTTLRVVTWNLWWQFGPWQERFPAIEETIRGLDPDVVALQEVWDDGTTSSAAALAADRGYEHVGGTRREWDGVWFANAVLSRWPIAGSEVRSLPAPPDAEEYRCVVRADVDGPRGPIQVFSTHLHWRFDHSHIRQDQVRAICRFVRESPERTFPPVVCGDFNAVPDSEEIRMMTGRRGVSTVQVEPPPVHRRGNWADADAA
jgi:endonuclease/exonuclease/phosphatase family metal-dependent hydrolase